MSTVLEMGSQEKTHAPVAAYRDNSRNKHGELDDHVRPFV